MEPNSEWQISLHSHNTLLISHKPISFGQIWGPDVICICGSNRNAAIFSVLLATRPSSLSPLVFQYPHSHISYSMAWLCDRSLQVNNGNEWQPSASNQKSLLFKACLHSASYKGEKSSTDEGAHSKAVWGCTHFVKSPFSGEAYHCTVWFWLCVHSCKPGISAETSLAQKNWYCSHIPTARKIICSSLLQSSSYY